MSQNTKFTTGRVGTDERHADINETRVFRDLKRCNSVNMVRRDTFNDGIIKFATDDNQLTPKVVRELSKNDVTIEKGVHWVAKL
jgi:hypothetical protein